MEDDALAKKITAKYEGKLEGEDALFDCDEDEHDDEEEEGSTRPNVDAAISALKADKETKRSKKIIKQLDKQAKKKAGKAKSKCVAQAKTSDKDMKPTLELDECDDFDPMISARSLPKETRVKTALDDFLCSISFARMNLAVKIPDEEAARSKHFLVSLFLELSWNSQVAVQGKVFRVYSTFRDECRKLFEAAHQRLQIGDETFDPLHLAKNLMAMVNMPVSQLHCECELLYRVLVHGFKTVVRCFVSCYAGVLSRLS